MTTFKDFKTSINHSSCQEANYLSYCCYFNWPLSLIIIVFRGQHLQVLITVNKMTLRFWFSAALLIYSIGLIESTAKCRSVDYSIPGMFLKGHTFKTQFRLTSLQSATWYANKRLGARATTSSLVRISVSWTPEPKKPGRRSSCQMCCGSTRGVHITEVAFAFYLIFLACNNTKPKRLIAILWLKTKVTFLFSVPISKSFWVYGNLTWREDDFSEQRWKWSLQFQSPPTLRRIIFTLKTQQIYPWACA